MFGNIVRFFSNDGVQLIGYYRCPPNAKGVLIHIHGTGGNFYEHPFIYKIADDLLKIGWGIFSFNNRGAGSQTVFRKRVNTTEGDTWGLFEGGCAHENYDSCIMDIEAAVNFVCSAGISNIIIQGHSLGGCKAVTYFDEKRDENVKGLILLSPCDIRGPSVLDKKEYDIHVQLAQKMIDNNEGVSLMPESAYPFPVDAITFLSLLGPNAKALIYSFSEQQYFSGPLVSLSIPILVTFGTETEFALRNLGKSHKEIIEALNWIKKRAINSPLISTAIIENAPHNYFQYESALAAKIIEFICELEI